MERKMLMVICTLLIGWPVLANQAVIESAAPVANGSKTSLVISYASTERLTYFALDSSDRVFTLDLPGVYSQVDFSQLDIAQVASIQQVPLNPDSNEGISIRFTLNEGVGYSIFDSNPGELIVLFEADQIQSTPEPTLVKHDEPKAETTALPQLSNTGLYRVIDGEYGEDRLHRLIVQANDQSGVLLLQTGMEATTKYFFLENPRRFVLDFRETVLSLREHEVALNQSLVQRIRIRQFQSAPEPISRLVLDLAQKTNVNVTPTPDGVAIAYAAETNELETLVAAIEQQGPHAVIVARTETEATSDIQGLVQSETSTAPAVESDFVEVIDVSEPAVDEALVADVPTASVTEMVASATKPAAPAIETRETIKPSSDEELVASSDIETIELTNPTEVETDAAPVILDDASESEPVATKTLTEMTVAESTDTEIAEDAVSEPQGPVATEVAVQEPKSIEDDSAPAVAVIPASEMTEEKPRVESEVVTIALPTAEATKDMPTVDLTGEKDKTDWTADIKPMGPKPVANRDDIEAELAAFENDTDDGSFYKILRNVPRIGSRVKTIVVTNHSIERSNSLGETRMMQEEAADDNQDFESLFRDPDADSGYERLDAQQTQYRGFEIQSIEVKHVSVVDLLRFIASQVGINLYIDTSVDDNLRATYRFRNIPWDQALDIILKNANLAKEFSNDVLRVATVDKFREEERARAELQLQRELSVPPETVTFPLSYAKAAEVVPIVEQYLSPRGTILMDERTNTLIIEDIPKRMIAIRALIKKLDKMISQVTIEARVVETTKRFLRELGIQWGLSADYSPEIGTSTGLDFPNRAGIGGPSIGSTSPGGLQGGYAVNFPTIDENPSGFGLTLGNFLDNFKLDISLQMLESDGHGQIISAPKITTQNNKTATIENGQRIPIQTVQRGTITIRYIDAVLELQVTPHITSDETIIMDLVVDKSEPDFTRTVQGNPVINIRKAETRVLVKNGGTAVIGGIFTMNEQETSRGIPKLRNVPVLKRLFGQEQKTYENQELLIFVTPRIVKY